MAVYERVKRRAAQPALTSRKRRVWDYKLLLLNICRLVLLALVSCQFALIWLWLILGWYNRPVIF